MREMKVKNLSFNLMMPMTSIVSSVASGSTSRYLADDAKIEFPEPGQRIHVIPVEIPLGSPTHVHRMA